MAIIHNGEVVTPENNILTDIWKSKTVFGEEEAQKPGMCIFNNTRYAIEMLHKHISNNSNIALHTDIDVDGIGTTLIIKRVLENISDTNQILVINKDKVHGIMQKHVDFFNNKKKIDLIIITDSSSNLVDCMKKFNCDVLCVDHHDIDDESIELRGKCDDGIHDYVVVNSTLDNTEFNEDIEWLRSKNISAFDNVEEYKGTVTMSCGLAIYELLRVYCSCYANVKLLENLLLYQWAAVTLITDVIDTLNERDQWYLEKTFFNMEVEHSLKIMMEKLAPYKAKLDKSYIGYTFAPIINKAIRAGASAAALDTVINNPSDIKMLEIYAEKQKKAIELATLVEVKDPFSNKVTLSPRIFNTEYIALDISQYGIHPNYTGVIAGRLCGDNHKNAAVYVITEDGKAKGSFRGRYKHIKYRNFFAEYSEDVYAQGHAEAFGFKCTVEQLNEIMSKLSTIEPVGDIKPFITIGDFTADKYGSYHVNDFNDFRKLGYILKIATGNARVTSQDEVYLRVKASDVVLKSTIGKVFIYNVFGMECKAFSPLSGNYFDLYPEYTNEINMYIR